MRGRILRQEKLLVQYYTKWLNWNLRQAIHKGYRNRRLHRVFEILVLTYFALDSKVAAEVNADGKRGSKREQKSP